MVYSQTKKTASIASITNQNQGGGSKKAGLPHLIARDSWTSVALRGTSQRMAVLKMPMTTSGVNQSRPVSVRPGTSTRL
jgi:hypothetical protein